MKISCAIITGLVVCFLFMFLGCSETPTSLEDQKANLETLNKYGTPGGDGSGGIPEPDEDSDRPPWAGGETGENPHTGGGNKGSDTEKGVDYGDLLIIERTLDGAPITEWIDVPEKDPIEVVHPIAFYLSTDDLVITDDDGIPIEAFDNGELLLFSYDPVAGVYVAPGDVVLPDAVNGVPVKELTTSEVDLGRLNLIRAPKSRLDQALEEAVGALNAPNVATISVDFCGRLTAIFDELNLETEDPLDHLMKTIDSPRESMAIYRELVENGFSGALYFIPDLWYVASGEETPDLEMLKLDLAASAFAAGSDKSGYVCVDEVVYCNTFLNLNESGYAQYALYTYNRMRFENRLIKMYWPDFPNGNPDEEPTAISIFSAQPEYFHFNAKWGEGLDWANVAAFRTAVDDAVQVLDFIHGDSTIEYVWPWEELFPPEI